MYSPQGAALTRRNYTPSYSNEVLSNAPLAYQMALIRDQKNQYNDEMAESRRQFDTNMGLQREIAEQQSKDSKRAALIGGVQALTALPKWTEKLFGGSADTAIKSGGAEEGVSEPLFATDAPRAESPGMLSSTFNTIKSGVSDYLGPRAAEGLSWSGLGQAGVGALAGGMLGDSDLEKFAIGAAVPLAWNVASDIFSGSTDILGSAMESFFPSLGGGLGALLFP